MKCLTIYLILLIQYTVRYIPLIYLQPCKVCRVSVVPIFLNVHNIKLFAPDISALRHSLQERMSYRHCFGSDIFAAAQTHQRGRPTHC